MSARSMLCAATVVAAPLVAGAGATTFPGQTEFTFSGFPQPGPTSILKVCPGAGACYEGAAATLNGGALAVSHHYDKVQGGVAVRGSIGAQDPSATLEYHTIELELHTRDFFSRNPDAHIVIAPRTLLPYVLDDGTSYNNYPHFAWMAADSGSVKRPHAYGNGLILGKVPCNQNTGVPLGYLPQASLANGIAIEHFLGAGAIENRTACPPNQIAFENEAKYSVKVGVRQAQCPDSAWQCRWVAYRIEKIVEGPVWGAPPNAKGGGDHGFRDNSQAEWRGWSALQVVDRPSWYISHIFTNPGAPSWSFQVRNVQVTASPVAPTWWTHP